MASPLVALVDKRGKLKDEGNAILEAAAKTAGMDEEQEKRYAEIVAEMGKVTDLIEATHLAREWERSIPGIPLDDPEPETLTAPSLGRPDPRAFKGPRLFASFGEQLQAIARASMPGGSIDPRLLEINAAAQGAGEAVPSDGGFLVQQDMVSGIERRMYDMGQLISRVRRIPVSGNGLVLNASAETSRADGSRLGGVRGYWVDEGTAPTATKPTFRRIELRLKKVAALAYATDELLADAAALTSIYTDGFAEELLFKVEDAIFEGDGQGKPLGFAVAANASLISVTKETNQAATSLVAQNVIKARSRLWSRSRANSVWFINQDCEPQLQQMTLGVGTGGVPVYLPASGLSEDGFDRLYGRPVIPIEYAATLGSLGDIVLADLSQYIVIDKGGVQQASSMHVAFVTDEMAFRATYRVDGQSAWNTVLTPFKGTGNTQSPFVGIAARA